MSMKKIAYRVRAAFILNGAWRWITWTDATCGGNKHAAIIDKGRELSATGWDFGNADFAEFDRAGF
jgi:hypothetical protein